MKIYAICPVSDKKVNEKAARINGAFTVVLLIVSGLTQSVIPLIFLTIDFIFRATDYSKYSLIGITSGGLVRYFGLNENIINAGPKLFAARVGIVFCSLAILSIVFNSFGLAIVLAGILGLFSFLEAAFGICVACEIYPFVYRLLYRAKFQ